MGLQAEERRKIYKNALFPCPLPSSSLSQFTGFTVPLGGASRLARRRHIPESGQYRGTLNYDALHMEEAAWNMQGHHLQHLARASKTQYLVTACSASQQTQIS